MVARFQNGEHNNMFFLHTYQNQNELQFLYLQRHIENSLSPSGAKTLGVNAMNTAQRATAHVDS